VRLARDTWLAIGLLVALIAIMVVAALGRGQDDQARLPRLASLSAAPEGGLALKLWLQKLNYTVLDDEPVTYLIPDKANIILVLEPSAFQSDELATLDAWVRNGGTLIAAGDVGTTELARYFDFGLEVWGGVPASLTLQSPLLLHPLIQSPLPAPAAPFQPLFDLVPSRPAYVTYLAAGDKPVLVSFDLGNGRVILSSTSYPFSNLGLKQLGDPQLMLNLLGLAKRQGPVWFDEWHHGLRGAATAGGPDNWLRYTPIGHSLLFVVAVIFLALLLQGRGFGRPVPLPRELRRRGVLEHITAMSNLGRLAGHRSSVLLQYHHELKRILGRRYRLDPAIPDADYVAYLVRYNPSIDGDALLAALSRLRQPNPSDAEMIRAAAEAAKWIKE
jgi:hypothetical protein